MISMTDAVANIPAGSLGVSGPAETSDAFARDVKKRLARLRIVSRLCSIVGAVLLAAVALLAGMIYMLVRPYKEATKLTTKVEM